MQAILAHRVLSRHDLPIDREYVLVLVPEKSPFHTVQFIYFEKETLNSIQFEKIDFASLFWIKIVFVFTSYFFFNAVIHIKRSGKCIHFIWNIITW